MAVAEARRRLSHHPEACSCTVVGGLAQEGLPCSALGQIVSQFWTRLRPGQGSNLSGKLGRMVHFPVQNTLASVRPGIGLAWFPGWNPTGST